MSEDVTDELLRALGNELRAQRAKRGLSRSALATAVGISDTTVGRAERGGPAAVSDTWRMARVLGVSLADLVKAAEQEVLRAHRDDATEAEPLGRERLLVLLSPEGEVEPTEATLGDTEKLEAWLTSEDTPVPMKPAARNPGRKGSKADDPSSED